MKKFLLVLLVLLFAASLGFAGPGAEKKKMTIAIIPMFVGHPWFVRCELGAKQAAEELGINYVFVGPEKADTAKQLDIFNDQVNKKVDAIILASSEVKAWEKPIADAMAKGSARVRLRHRRRATSPSGPHPVGKRSPAARTSAKAWPRRSAARARWPS